MKKRLLISALAMTALSAQCVCATTFTFQDEYFLTQNKAYSTVAAWSGVSGNTPNTSHGYYYQETSTSPITMTNMGYTGLSGEFIQNTNQELALFGWNAATASSSTPATSVYNLNNPSNGTNTYFQYTVGGTKTAFDFNGFDLKGNTPAANLSFTLQGYLGGILVYSAILNVTGNTFATFTENWKNVDTVEIVSTAGLPVNWGSGALYMDNIEINDPITAPVPEPATMLLFGTGIAGLAAVGRRKSS